MFDAFEPCYTVKVWRVACVRALFSLTSSLSPGGKSEGSASRPPSIKNHHASSPSLSIIQVRYDATGGPCAGSDAVTLHAGHSGWRDTVDVALTRVVEVDKAVDGASSTPPPPSDLWEGALSIPVSRLAAPGHLEVQAAFRATRRDSDGGGEAWDAAEGGRNYSLTVVSAPGGLAPAPTRRESRALVASLLTRLDALAASGALPLPAASLLRTLAWQGDGPLLRTYERVRSSPDATAATALGARCGLVAARPGIHALHVSSEMAPFAKVGGLADVVTALARAHQADGALAEVLIPKYACMDYSCLSELRQLGEVRVPWRDAPGGSGSVPTAIWACVAEGLPVYLLEPLTGLGSGPAAVATSPPFWRGASCYGEPDDTARFLFFACAAVAFLDWSGRTPDVLHLHDWQAAAVAPLLAARRASGGGHGGGSGGGARASATPAVTLTLHNMAFQGRLSPHAAAAAPGLDPAVTPGAAGVLREMSDAAGRKGPDGITDLNLLQGGIAAAHAVTTVSPTYAREVLGPEAGCGLEGVLAAAAVRGRFRGVLNGIDSAEIFDPASDRDLAANFSAGAPWPGKDACKRALLAEVGFAPDEEVKVEKGSSAGAATASPSSPLPLFPDGAGGLHPGGRPLLAIVSRLSAQKGLDLMEGMVEEAVSRGARVVVLGTAPDPADARRFDALAAAAEHGQDVRYRLCFSDVLARRIYAGADALLVPSRYEPCGLAQLIALRFGTIPIVRRTGGLADTVVDIADGGAPEAVRNGVVFDGLEASAARHAVRRALDAFRADGGAWWRGTLVPRAAGQDWSWSRSAAQYLEVYRQAVGAARGW